MFYEKKPLVTCHDTKAKLCTCILYRYKVNPEAICNNLGTMTHCDSGEAVAKSLQDDKVTKGIL